MSSKSKKRPQNKGSSLPLIGIIGLALVLLAAGLGILLTSGLGGAGQQPKLTVDHDQIDFGKVPLNKPVKAVFTITNTGEGTLSLDASTPIKVLKGCWPPDAVVSSTTLKAGESATVSAEFMMHAGMEGPHLFDVTVKTNDPTQPEKHLLIASDWEPSGS